MVVEFWYGIGYRNIVECTSDCAKLIEAYNNLIGKANKVILLFGVEVGDKDYSKKVISTYTLY